MAKSVKLFQQVEKVFQSLGIRTAQPKLYDRISVKCYILLMSLSIISNSSMVYLLFAAKSTVADRGDAFYIGTSQYSNIFYIITYIREAPKLRHLIGKFEIFFEESKWRILQFQQANILVEKKINKIESISRTRVEWSGNRRNIFHTARENRSFV